MRSTRLMSRPNPQTRVGRAVGAPGARRLEAVLSAPGHSNSAIVGALSGRQADDGMGSRAGACASAFNCCRLLTLPYLHELTDGFKAERVIGAWIDFYNTERPHSALDGQTPAEVYGAEQPVDMMDKTIALPTSPQAQQHQQNVINRILAA